MCLRSVDLTKPDPEGYGYKTFTLVRSPTSPDDVLQFLFRPLNGSFHVPQGEWIQAESNSIWDETFLDTDFKIIKYESGFHIYVDRPHCLWTNEIVVPVRYRMATYSGWESYGGKVVVAQQIFVPKNIF